MSPERAVGILEDLVDSIRYLTDKLSPEMHHAAKNDVVDALECAIEALNERIVVNQALEAHHQQQSKHRASKPKSAKKSHAENAGKPWPHEADVRLLELYKAGMPVAALARQFQRTSSAIRARLVRLGIAENRFAVPEVYEEMVDIDNEELRYRYLHGESIPQLAAWYERTEKAIRARLFYMGLGGSGPDLIPGRDGNDE